MPSWYPSWIEYHNGKIVYPKSLDPLVKWKHPFMKENLPSAMHEDSYASDISNLQGPVPENAKVQYFQVKEKGDEFSGMCPSFAFIDEYHHGNLILWQEKHHLTTSRHS